MTSRDEDIFKLYKPLRNQFSKYNVIDSLHLIWAYARNYTFDLPFPKDIPLSDKFLNSKNLHERRYFGIPEFELEFLMKEMILHCEEKQTNKSLKQQGNTPKLINYLRYTLSEGIDSKFTLGGNIFAEFKRLAHRQFIWQRNVFSNHIFRYYKVFSEPTLAEIIKNRFDLTTYELFVIGFFFFRHLSEYYRVQLPINSTTPQLSNEKIAKFLEHFSIPLDQIRAELKEYQQINENLFYTYNPIKSHPILVYQNAILSPIPLFIFWQVTGGIYYYIDKDKEPNFANAFGTSFQNYIGEVLVKACTNENFNILEEKFYSDNKKQTTDWIIEDNDAVVFIECKTKRMLLSSKAELNSDNGLEKDLANMADFIIQLYKGYIDYSNNEYPQIAFNANKKFIPIVVTLEEWFINFNHEILEKLKIMVLDKMKAKNLDTTLVDKHPYHIFSADDLERDIQLIDSLGIASYFEMASNHTLAEFAQTFKFRNIFDGEFEKIFLDPLRT